MGEVVTSKKSIELNISIAAADVWTVHSGYVLVFIPGFMCTVGRK